MFWHKPKLQTVKWSECVDDNIARLAKTLADIEGHVAGLERRMRHIEYREKSQDLLAPHIAGSTLVAQQLTKRVAELLDAIKRLEA